MSGTLYIVGTPIGNLSDISQRALDTLTDVNFIAAEDTRVTRKLLSYFGISTTLISYHQHSTDNKINEILDKIETGQNAALVSDAGMPGISDPGEELVRLAWLRKINTVVVPGPTALTSAVALSGMDTRKFMFEGFLKGKKSEQKKQLEDVCNINRTIVYYEAPHKLVDTLSLMYEVFGNRKITLCRELTKIYEETTHFTLDEAIEYYNKNIPKGEFVIIVEGNTEVINESPTFEQSVNLVLDRERTGVSLSSAAKDVAQLTGYKKSELYRQAVALKD